MKKLKILFEFALDLFVGLCFGSVGLLGALFISAVFNWQSLSAFIFSLFVGVIFAAAGIMISLVLRVIINDDGSTKR